MITLTDLNKHYGQHHVLNDIDLSIQEGEIFGIIGKSGAGKSTLLRCLNLLERPDRGTVFINNESLTELNPEALRHARHHIGMIFQHFNLLHAKSVYDNVALPLRIQNIPESDIKKRVHELLTLVELGDKMHAKPDDLSGGQKQRVAIARALSSSPKVLLCDEATSALDPELVGEVVDVMERLAKEGMTIIAVTHEMHFARDVADRVLIMDEGIWVEEGTPEKIFNNPEKERTRQFLAHIL